MPKLRNQFEIRSLGFGAYTPSPYAKTKIKFVHYRKVVSLRRDKKKSIHHITRHIWLRLLYKSLHPYLPPLRYTKHQICRYVMPKSLPPVVPFRHNGFGNNSGYARFSLRSRHRITRNTQNCLSTFY